MKQISLDGVMINNFRSFRQVYVSLSTCDGLKLFSGQNLAEPRLGANGIGKTSFWDAVFWCFYGTSLKGLKTSSLVQWNQKTTEVIVELSINTTTREIYRSGPPNKIEIDGKPATQDEVDELLGLTADQFTHSIIFGQGVPLFPDLPISERGALLDSVLNLDIWQRASESATRKVVELEKKESEKKIELSRVDGQLSQLPTDESIQIEINKWNDNKGLEIENIREQIVSWEDQHTKDMAHLSFQSEKWKEEKLVNLENQANEIDLLERELANTEDLLKEIPPIVITDLQTELENTQVLLGTFQKKYTELQTELKLITKPREFWVQNNTCPSCKQPITEDAKQEHLVEIEIKEQEFTNGLNVLSEQIEFTKEILQEKKEALTTLRNLQTENIVREGQYKSSIKRINNEIKRIEQLSESLLKEIESECPYLKQIKRMKNEVNPYISQLEQVKKEENPYFKNLAETKIIRESLRDSKTNLTNEVDEISKISLAASYWKNGFKRIRLYFIQQILGVLEIEIQSAISALGLNGWSVKLATESETKSGTTKLGVQIHIKSPVSEGGWEVWSGGEAQRLRLAIAMGLGSLIQRASGSWYTWEILDEPTSWLSSEGIEDLLQALQYRAESRKKSIWLIDHRALTFSGFKEIWLVTKKAEGSSIQLMESS